MGLHLAVHDKRTGPTTWISVSGAVKVTVDLLRDISVASTPTLESPVTTSFTLSSEIGVVKVQVNCIDAMEVRSVSEEK